MCGPRLFGRELGAIPRNNVVFAKEFRGHGQTPTKGRCRRAAIIDVRRAHFATFAARIESRRTQVQNKTAPPHFGHCGPLSG